MAEKTICDKMLLKPGRSLAVINPPSGYLESLLPLPDFARLADSPQEADVVQLFIRTYTELDEQLPHVKIHLRPSTILWVCFPKQTGKVRTDINGEILYVYAAQKNWKGNGMFSINSDWSAMRFKPV
ncbi:MAG: hypothetical protein GYA58_06405 [Anaerolineaceae bacterium]|nr:hypothetical protein [Anaerolineaceae bacterium]